MIERTSSCACGSTRFSSVQSPPLTTDGALVSPSSSAAQERSSLVKGEVGGGDRVPIVARAHVRARGVRLLSGALAVVEQRDERRRRTRRRCRRSHDAVADVDALARQRRRDRGRARGHRLQQLVLDPGAAVHRARVDGGAPQVRPQVGHVGDTTCSSARTARAGGAAGDRQVRVRELAPHERHDPIGQAQRGLLVGGRVERAGEQDPVAARRVARREVRRRRRRWGSSRRAATDRAPRPRARPPRSPARRARTGR